MKMKAAVMIGVKQPLEIREVELDPPMSDEVLVTGSFFRGSRTAGPARTAEPARPIFVKRRSSPCSQAR